MFAERNIWNHLRENHKVRESEESEVFHHEEETETPEDILNEDWRSGTFDKNDALRYAKKTKEDVSRILFSLENLIKEASDPEVLKILKKLGSEIQYSVSIRKF